MTLVKRDYRFGDSFSEMDRLFDRSFTESDFWPGFFPNSSYEGMKRNFPVNVYEDDEGYTLIAELPGVQKESIDLKLENEVLSISAKRRTGEGENANEFAMTRAITVGDDVNPDAVSAKLDSGILTVTLPKAEERRPKSIAIK